MSMEISKGKLGFNLRIIEYGIDIKIIKSREELIILEGLINQALEEVEEGNKS